MILISLGFMLGIVIDLEVMGLEFLVFLFFGVIVGCFWGVIFFGCDLGMEFVWVIGGVWFDLIGVGFCFCKLNMFKIFWFK